jgi:hypothetical protein
MIKKRYFLIPIFVLGILLILTFVAQFFLSLKKEFSIVILPDIQNYSQNFPQILDSQTKWIVGNIRRENIAFVAQEGDIVNNWNEKGEWENASKSLSLLDGKVPYSVLPGNHDIQQNRKTDFFNQYFPVEKYKKYPWYGGNFPPQKNDSSYQLFSEYGDDYIVLNLEFCPTKDIIEWAKKVLFEHSNRRAIIVTHGYLNEKAERNVHVPYNNKGGCDALVNNTQYIWDNLIYYNTNVFLVFSGHVHAEARRVDKNMAGKNVYQILADYQDEENGGNGWLRIIEFLPEEDKIHVKTFSPSLNQYKTGESSDFILDYNMLR